MPEHLPAQWLVILLYSHETGSVNAVPFGPFDNALEARAWAEEELTMQEGDTYVLRSIRRVDKAS